MRAIASLLLGLLALTAARPACAVQDLRAPIAMAHGGADGTRTLSRNARASCASRLRDGVVRRLRARLRVGGSAGDVAACPPAHPNVAPAVPLAGLGPVAAIPPPRPIG